MRKSISDFFSDFFENKGSIVEKKENGLLEVISPREVSEILRIPEFARLCFSYDAAHDNAIYASYDSDFFITVEKLLTGKGRFSVAGIDATLPNIEKLSRIISERIILKNAISRLDGTETKNASYLLIYFKYAALSDEKHEGILPMMINETTMSITYFDKNLPIFNNDMEEPEGIERANLREVLRSAYSSAKSIVITEMLKDFIKSLERRLNRDIRRVYEYYEALSVETKALIKRKTGSSEEADDTISIKGSGINKLQNKLEAVEAERKWKINDLIAKYSLNIQIIPVVVIRIITNTPVIWINIKRRLNSRRFPVMFNPIYKQLDDLPCESCFNPNEGYYICDDKLHIICGKCFTPCPHCGKQYCKACYKNKCPKCKK